MQRTKKSTFLSILLVTVMAFTMIQVGPLTSFAAGEITSFDITCEDFTFAVAKEGETIPEPEDVGFPVTITTEGVDCPAGSVYGGWYVEKAADDWQPAQGTFEVGKKYMFRIDFDGISPEQDYTFATTMGATVNGVDVFTWADANPWNSESGIGWLVSPPITIEAQTNFTYTIKFDANGGEGTMDDLSLDYDEEKALPVNAFTKENHTFTGWTTKADGSGDFVNDGEVVRNLTDNETITLYAQWEYNPASAPTNYTIKFDANTGEGTMEDLLMVYDVEKALTANTFTKEGYTFKRWNTKADGSGTAYTDEQVVNNLTTIDNDTVTLYAQWSGNTYTITYGDIGFEIPGPYYEEHYTDTVTMGRNWTVRGGNTYSKPGFHFEYWNYIPKSASGVEGHWHVGDTQPPWDIAEDVRYAFPEWELNTSTFKFDSNGGVGSMADYNTSIFPSYYLPKNSYTNEGYIFTGWNTKADGSGMAVADEGYWLPLSTTNNSTVTLYAQWGEGSYVIEFKKNDFINSFCFGSMNGLPMGVDEEKALPVNTFINPGYTFRGWKTRRLDGSVTSYADGQVVKNLATSGKVVLYAQWEPNQYSVKFDANTGTGTMNDWETTYDIDRIQIDPPANAFTKTGYTFTGWNTKADGSGETYIDKQFGSCLRAHPAGTVTLYAQWEPNAYTIKFDGNSGKATMEDLPMVYDAEKALTANTFTKEDHTFTGWNTKADGSGTAYTDEQVISNLTDTNEGIITLYAQWKEDTTPAPTTYTIKFDANTGEGTMEDLPMVYDEEKALTANTFTKEDHTFTGWNTKADGSGTAYTDEQVISNLTDTNEGIITLYAQWKEDTTPAPTTYTIKFDANTGEGTMEDLPMVYDEEKALTANTFTKENNTFTGWNTKADGSGTAYTNEQVVKNLTDTNEGIVTLYAQWKEGTTPAPTTYTIKFDANGGEGTMDDLDMVYDVEKALTANTFTKENHTFTGWNTEANGSGVFFYDGESVIIMTDDETITLYAQWAPVQAQKEITIDEIPSQAYTGKAIEPPLTVKADGIPLTIDQDYDVEYADNINPGTAKATVTFKGEYDGTEAKTVQFTIKSSFKAKSLWVSKHENTYVTFNWTGAPNNSLATAWDVQYRTKQIGTQYAWSKWTSSRESGKTLSKRVYLKPNYTIEFKVKHETDAAYLRSVFTTPAGGKYQSITQCRVKVTATASGALYRQGTKTLALKTGVNFSGDTGNIIYIKKGTSIKVAPNHVYPRSNFSQYPRLYPNHAWYDVADTSKVSLTGKASTAGMKDGAVTIKGLNVGTTTVKITSCNGRGATLTIVVK